MSTPTLTMDETRDHMAAVLQDLQDDNTIEGILRELRSKAANRIAALETELRLERYVSKQNGYRARISETKLWWRAIDAALAKAEAEAEEVTE